MADENDPAVANRPRTRVVNEPVKALATPAAVKPERDPQQADVASVRVLLRVRPTSVSDLRLGYTSHAIECADERVLVPVGGGMRTFNFDRVLPPSAGQQQLFDSMTDMVDGFLEGYNSTLFAYGQTGSGKTYTMGTRYARGPTRRRGHSAHSQATRGGDEQLHTSKSCAPPHSGAGLRAVAVALVAAAARTACTRRTQRACYRGSWTSCWSTRAPTASSGPWR
jgi:hypothetical protein